MNRFLFILLTFFFISPSFSQEYADPKKRKIRDFEILFDSTVGRVPGANIPIGIRLEKKNGSISYTKGYVNGKQGWTSFIVKVEGGVFVNGQIQIDRSYQADEIFVSIYHRSDPAFIKNIMIPMDYKGKVEAYVTGFSGREGRDGRDGRSTSTGNGTDGEPGDDG